nr:pheromone-processing carboxypeptidase KEX1-like; partial [Biomphalaria glabrata]
MSTEIVTDKKRETAKSIGVLIAASAKEQKFKGNQYIKTGRLSLSDLGLHNIRERKLLVHLKLLPKDVDTKIAKTFIRSLFKAIAYKECLLIELDEHVAKAIKSDAHRMGKVTWMIKSSDFTKKEEGKKSTYSNFKRLIITGGELMSLNFGAEENEKLYRCEIKIESKKDNAHSMGTDNDVEGQSRGQVDGADTGRVSGEDYNDSDNDVFYDDDDDDFDDEDDKGFCFPLSHNYVTSLDKCAKVVIELPQSFSSQDKEACKVDTLRKLIFKETAELYEIQDNELESFYLGLALNYESFTINGPKLQWKDQEVKNLLNVIVRDLKADFLKRLLVNYKGNPGFIEALNEIYESKDGLFKDILSSADIQIRPADIQIRNDDNEIKPVCFLKLFLELILRDKLEASLYYCSQVNYPIGAALLAHYILKEKLENAHTQIKKEKCTKFLKIYEDIAMAFWIPAITKTERELGFSWSKKFPNVKNPALL